MDERSAALVDVFLEPLPWRRPKTSLLAPLVELLRDEDIVFWDARAEDDPRAYGAVFVVYTADRVIVHQVQHARGDRCAVLRTDVALRRELADISSAMEPETPYSGVEVLCDWLVDHWARAGRGADSVCAWVARRSRWFERRWYSLEQLSPPRNRSVVVRYTRLGEPITLPLSWDDAPRQRNREFDAFLPSLVRDLP